MPKSKKKKKKDVKVLIPEKPMANLTSAMRQELYATPESFENATVQTSSSDTEKGTEAKISEKMSTKEKKSEKEINNTAMITKIQNTDTQLHKMATKQLLKDDSSIAKMQVISDSELDRRITEQEVPSEKQKAIPVTPLWGLYETILTKKCIDEVVENFFASPRDDIELTMRLSRRDMFPRLHVELAPIYQDLHIEAGRFQQNALTPFHIKNRRWRFDDLLRTEDINNNLPSKDLSMQSMESRSASICYAQSSDATTARSPSYDYLSSAYSYLVAFVKSVVPNRNQTSTKNSNDNK
ncbi:hypothetical protein QQG55_16830 [Brugia pahangi]